MFTLSLYHIIVLLSRVLNKNLKGVFTMTGQEVKQLILSENVKCWQVAELWGLNDGNFSRRMRHPFSVEEVGRIRAIIAEIKANKKPSE